MRQGDDKLGTDEGTTKLGCLMAGMRTDLAKRILQLSTYLLGPLESLVAAERAKTQRLKVSLVPLQTQVRGCPKVGLVVMALGAVAAVDPLGATSGCGIR